MNSDEPEQFEDKQMNLGHEYWVKKFLFPYALDLAPLKLSEIQVNGRTVSDSTNDFNPGNADKFNVMDT